MLMERKSQLQTTLSVLESEEMEIRGGSAECLDAAPSVATPTTFPVSSEPLPFDVVSWDIGIILRETREVVLLGTQEINQNHHVGGLAILEQLI